MTSPNRVRLIPVVGWPLDTPPPSSVRFGFVPLSDVPTPALPALIEAHLQPLASANRPIEETCPFFGGLVLAVDEEYVLYPQCCGDLSDVEGWMRTLAPDFHSGPLAKEGHPCPEAVRTGDRIELRCSDEDEPFDPPVQSPLAVSVPELRRALDEAMQELVAFRSRIRLCEPFAGTPVLADLLVFGREEPHAGAQLRSPG